MNSELVRVLVTGSSGRIGAAICRNLNRDYTIFGLDRKPGPNTTHVGDLADEAVLESAVAGVAAVVHTAALHAPHVGEVSEEDFLETNVLGTERLLKACRSHGIGRVVYTSTTSLYGHALIPDGKAVWVTEALRPEPRDIYDETKIAAEAAVRRFADEYGATGISLRMSRCFPEPERLMAIYRLYRGVDARDVAYGHRLALEAAVRGYAVLNISAASPFQSDETEELLTAAPRVIERHFPWAPQAFEARGWALPESIDRVYVTQQAARLLDYRPVYNFPALFDRKTIDD